MSAAQNGSTEPPPMEYEAALRRLMLDSKYASLMFDSYIEDDPVAAAKRFESSAEWAAVLTIVGSRVKGSTVLDLGAGNGVASVAFADAGAATVIAVEPSPSPLAGRGAIRAINRPEVVIVDAKGEALPLDDASVDIVYGRQVLHHAANLEALLRECARVLRPDGMALLTREHVVDDESQLAAFLEAHPVHQLAGGENAFPLGRYLDALSAASLRVSEVIGPWDSIINAFPTARTQEQFEALPRVEYVRRFGMLGRLISRLPGAGALVRRRKRESDPGRLFSFVARKPG